MERREGERRRGREERGEEEVRRRGGEEERRKGGEVRGEERGRKERRGGGGVRRRGEEERKRGEYVQTLLQCTPPTSLGHQCSLTFCSSRSGLSVATTSASSWSSRPSRVTVKLMRQACACISGL